jgi:hypothetical protein
MRRGPRRGPRGPAQRAGDDEQQRCGQDRRGEPSDRSFEVRVGAGACDGRVAADVQRADHEVRDAEHQAVAPERVRHRQRGDEHRRHRAQQDHPHEPLVGPRGVAEPRVARPREPQRGEDRQPLDEPRPRRVGRHEPAHLRDREHEDQIEEQLERRDALLDLLWLFEEVVAPSGRAHRSSSRRPRSRGTPA